MFTEYSHLPVTYGNSILQRKRKPQLATAKAKIVSVKEATEPRPLSVSERLHEIFGVDVCDEIREASVANARVVAKERYDKAEKVSVQKNTVEYIKGHKEKGNGPSAIIPDLLGEEFFSEQVHEFSEIYMGNPTETSTPVKSLRKETPPEHNIQAQISSLTDENLHKHSGVSESPCPKPTPKHQKGATDERSPDSPTAAKIMDQEKMKSTSIVSKHLFSHNNVVMEGLFKLADAGFVVQLSKNRLHDGFSAQNNSSDIVTKIVGRPSWLTKRIRRISRGKKKRGKGLQRNWMFLSNRFQTRNGIGEPNVCSNPYREVLMAHSEKTLEPCRNQQCEKSEPSNMVEQQATSIKESRERHTKYAASNCTPSNLKNRFQTNDFLDLSPDPMGMTANLDGHYMQPAHMSIARSVECNVGYNKNDQSKIPDEQKEKHESEIAQLSVRQQSVRDHYRTLLAQCAPGPDPIDLLRRRKVIT